MDEGMAERDQLYQRAEKLSAMLAAAAGDLTGAVADVNAGELGLFPRVYPVWIVIEVGIFLKQESQQFCLCYIVQSFESLALQYFSTPYLSCFLDDVHS